MVYVVVAIAGAVIVVLALLALGRTVPIGRKAAASSKPGPIAQRLAESEPTDPTRVHDTEGS